MASPKPTKEMARRGLIKKYSTVVDELPDWAQEALGSSMGSVHVSARDSFEIYYSNLKNLYPLEDPLIFRKRFAEIYREKAHLVLKRLVEHRAKHQDHFFTNDYFWQEFRPLFAFVPKVKKWKTVSGGDPFLWDLWNRKLTTLAGYNKAAEKVGLVGIGVKKRIQPGERNKKEVRAVKWR